MPFASTRTETLHQRWRPMPISRKAKHRRYERGNGQAAQSARPAPPPRRHFVPSAACGCRRLRRSRFLVFQDATESGPFLKLLPHEFYGFSSAIKTAPIPGMNQHNHIPRHSIRIFPIRCNVMRNDRYAEPLSPGTLRFPPVRLRVPIPIASHRRRVRLRTKSSRN